MSLKQTGNLILGLSDCLEDVGLWANQLVLKRPNVVRYFDQITLKDLEIR